MENNYQNKAITPGGQYKTKKEIPNPPIKTWCFPGDDKHKRGCVEAKTEAEAEKIWKSKFKIKSKKKK